MGLAWRAGDVGCRFRPQFGLITLHLGLGDVVLPSVPIKIGNVVFVVVVVAIVVVIAIGLGLVGESRMLRGYAVLTELGCF